MTSLLFGGTELIQFIAALAVFHQDDWKKGMNSSYSLYPPGAIGPILHIDLVQNSSGARNLSNSVPQAATTTFDFSSV